MPARSWFRGYPVYWDELNECWRYADNGERAGFSTNHIRPCAKCGLVFEGSNKGLPDPCLGTLPGVDNACCGHGIRKEAYIRFTNGVVIRGFEIETEPETGELT